VEAIECPTTLCNGYGEHNIQGIGDKHIPLIHNVMNTDLVVGVSDLASDSLNLLFGGNVGRSYLAGRRKIDPDVVRTFDDIGISGLANIVAAVKVARHLDYGADDVVMTVATDSALLYESERQSFLAHRYRDGFDEVNAGEIFSRHLEGIADDHRSGAHPFRSQTGFQSRLLHVGGAAGAWRSMISIVARTSGSGATGEASRSGIAFDEEFNTEVGAGRAH
jgi:hypothetical protein